MGTNRRLIISSTGYPGTNDTLRFIQEAINEPITALAQLCGDKVILTGVVVTGEDVSNGYVVINGEILPFEGGQLQTQCSILEDVETAIYDADNDNDGQQDVLPIFKTRKVVFGTAGLTPFNFSELTRLTAMNRLQPIGTIVMWSGAINQLPSGWALCDGQNGTPDLRNRFIVGAGDEYNVGNNGGLKEVTLIENQMPVHSHQGSTDATGGHSHSISIANSGTHSHYGHVAQASGTWRGGGNDSSPNSTSNPGQTAQGGAHTHSAFCSTDGTHSHSITTNNKGGNQAHENRPPYYSLAFIIFKG